VTGAGSEIGRAAAIELARTGASVVVNDLAADSLGEIVTAIEAAGATSP
jgi:NAD(P)-dependent dehydrogenase (short-subunit alcohol dehydrogenase family)